MLYIHIHQGWPGRVTDEEGADEDPLQWVVVDERPDDDWVEIGPDRLIRYISALLQADAQSARKVRLAQSGFRDGLNDTVMRRHSSTSDASAYSTYYQSGAVLGRELRELIQWASLVDMDAEPREEDKT